MKIPDDKKRVFDEFESLLVICKHGLKAYYCGQCKGKNWPDSKTQSGRTIAQVIEDLAEQGKIDKIEFNQRIGKKIKKRRLEKIALATGATIAGGLLIYESGKLIFRLFAHNENNKPK